MTGIEKITGRILSGADEYVAKTIADAEERAGDILADAEDEVKRIKADTRKKAEADAEAIKQRAKSSAALVERNIMLGAKSDLIDASFTVATEIINSLPADRYTAFLAKLLDEAVSESPDAAYTIKSNPRDTKTVAAIVKGKPITVSNDAAAIEGGFMLRRGDIEINCSTAVIVNALRDSMEAEVCAALFG